MNFYSLSLDINERREHFLELFAKGDSHRLQKAKSFVIDVTNFNTFKVISIPHYSIVKSFVIGKGDFKFSDCDFDCDKIGNDINIRFQPKVTHVFTEPKTIEKVIKDDITFEELESYENYNKPKEIPKEEISYTQHQQIKQDLGPLNDYIALRFIVNDYGLKLEASLIKPLDKDVFENNDLKLNLQLEIDGTIYENSIIITLSHPSQFLGIALDFGSESSQMTIKRYDYTEPFHAQSPENENLFKNIQSYHINKGWIERNTNYDFYQEEPGTNFYKSIFFLKENLTGDYANFDQEPFIKNAKDDLKMLVNTEDGFTTLTENKFHQIPNLKILHKHERILESYNFEIEKSGYPIPRKLRDLKQKVYNTILETMILSFLKKEFILYDNQPRNIRMMLLIPNNYDTKDINKTQTQLNNIFEKLSQEEEYSGKIMNWEVLTISESDASFFGYINKNNVAVRNNKDYIIIDSGKGTTDFSIIRTGNENIYNLKPIYRNGFTGAGNMISYAVFETVLQYIREKSTGKGEDIQFIRNKIIDVLTSNDLEERNKFYNQIEQLKFNYRDKQYENNVRQNWDNARSGDGDIGFHSLSTSQISSITTLTELLANLNNVTDFYGYINEVCHFIVNNVVSYLKIIKDNKKDIDFAGVVFTGRAFKFKMLSDLMIQRLVNELGIAAHQITVLQGNELKEICVRGVFNNSIKLNAEVTGYPIQFVYKDKEDMPKREEQLKEKKSLGRKFFGFFINDLADLQKVSEIKSVDSELEFDLLQRSQFLIGCKKYAIRNDEFFANLNKTNYQSSIDFTQRGYVMRRKINGKVDVISAMEEIDDGGNEDKALIIPSLFPNHIEYEYVQALQKEVSRKSSVYDEELFKPFLPDNNESNNNNNNQNDNPLFF